MVAANQCSKNERFAGIWAGAAKRIPEPFSECAVGNLKFKSRAAAAQLLWSSFGWECRRYKAKTSHTQHTRKGKQLDTGLRHLRSKNNNKQ